MGNYEQLKQSVSDVIKTNGKQEITGSILQNVLLTIISTVGANATFAGIATPTTNPGTPDGPVFYLASESGTYTNFGGAELQDGLSVLMWNGSWNSQQIFSVDDVPTAGSDNLVKSGGVQEELVLGAVYDVSAKNPTGGSNNDGKWESLSALLSDANLNTLIPTAVRKGGMSIKFIQISGNKYVQYRYMLQYENTTEGNNSFVNAINWRNIESEFISYANSLRFYDEDTESYDSEEVRQRSAVVLEMYADGEPFEDENPLRFTRFALINNKKQLAFIRKNSSVWDIVIDKSTDFTGITIETAQVSGRIVYIVVNWSAPYTTDNHVIDIANGCYSLNNNPAISAYIEKNRAEGVEQSLSQAIKGVKLLQNATTAEIQAVNNLKFVRFFGNIDVSELRIGTIYNDSQIPRRIMIKRPNNKNSILFDFPQDSNYMKVENSQFAAEIYYDWNNHTTNVNEGYIGSHIQVVPFALNPYVKSAVDKLNQDVQDVQGVLFKHNYAADYIGLSNLGQVLTDIENNVDDTSGVFNTKVSRAKYTTQSDPHFTYSIAKNYNLFVSELRKYLVGGNATLRIEFDIYNCGSTAVSYINGIRYLNPKWVIKTKAIDLPPQTVVHFVADYTVPAGGTFSDFSAYDSFSANIPDGFIMTNLKLYIVAEPKEVSGLSEIREDINSIEEQISQDDPIVGKTIAIMGDSIMMLMRTNYVNNTVSYEGTDGNTYTRNQLTLVNGLLYLTSSLSNGQVVSTSIRCEVVNSDQSGLDSQDWPSLKTALGVQNLYNLGLGGAMFLDRGVCTAYPYNDGNGEATDLPNEVRWLLRKIDEGDWTAPDAIVIWLGTNGAGEPATDNYDAIMALDYEYLDSLDGYSHRHTFYGGLRWSLETLYRNLPYCTILLVSPVQTNPKNYRTYTALSNTAAAIKKMGHRYSCQFIDALNEIGVVDFYERSSSTPYRGSDGDYYALSSLTEISGVYYVTSTLVDGQPVPSSVTAVLIPARFLDDGLHPNSAGKKVWTNYLVSQLKAKYYSKR